MVWSPFYCPRGPRFESWRLEALSALIENVRKRKLPLTEAGLGNDLINSLNLIVENKAAETGDRVAALRLLANISDNTKQVRTIFHSQLNAISLFAYSKQKFSTF